MVNNSIFAPNLRSTDDRWAGPAAHCRDEKNWGVPQTTTALAGHFGRGLHGQLGRFIAELLCQRTLTNGLMSIWKRFAVAY